MAQPGTTVVLTGRGGQEPPDAQARRQRWLRVRVSTDEGVWLARLRLETGVALHEMIGDDRTYLPLWDASLEGLPGSEEFLVVHKAAIHCVIVVGEDPAPERVN